MAESKPEADAGREQQLRLQMQLPPVYDYGAWVRHAGVEQGCNRLALWGVHGGALWLTSDHVAGKSHLLRTLACDLPCAALLTVHTDHGSAADSREMVQRWVHLLQPGSHWLIDVEAGAMPEQFAHALFHLLERARDLQRHVVVAWRGDADSLPPELSSRLRAMETVEMTPPADDDALLQILRASAGELQWDIRAQVLQAMLTYLPRQLDVLIFALNMLETNSFEQQHKPGPAWVKQQLMRIAGQLHSASV